MRVLQQGSIRLFRVAGIDVFMHWSWLVVAYFQITYRRNVGVPYSSLVWNVIEYLAIFTIVLLHRVRPCTGLPASWWSRQPDCALAAGRSCLRPAPAASRSILWSIAAGPLVNVVLVPITVGMALMMIRTGWLYPWPDLRHFFTSIAVINIVLLVFNLLPIYPLDGGQILRSLLWFVLGPVHSLMAASIIGLAGVAGVVALVFFWGLEWSLWTAIMAMFVVWQCWGGIQQSRLLARFLKMPRRMNLACPSCGAAPLVGEYWICDVCGCRFDTFAAQAVCPLCRKQYAQTRCLQCKELHPIVDWFPAAAMPPTPEEARSVVPNLDHRA